MATILLYIIAFLIILVLFFTTGKRTPSRAVSELPAPSDGVRHLVKNAQVIDAIKLYRRETACSLHEAKQVIDSIRGKPGQHGNSEKRAKDSTFQ